jgi:AcrR family transcriptional regulator
MSAGRSLAILALMQYLSDRLNATKTGGPREDGREARHRAVATEQRRRLLDATERLVAERGAAGTTIDRIAKRARVSSVSYYDHFASREDAIVAAFDRGVAESRAALAAALPAGLSWPEQVRVGLRALLELVEDEPARARMCLVEAQKGGPALLERYEAALDLALPKLREGRLLDSAAEDLPETLEEATVAGVAWLLRERLETGGPEGVRELLPRLVDVVLAPYLGSGEAGRLSLAGGSS